MDRAADTRRDLERAAATLRGKMATDDFDVFLCHASPDKPAAKHIGEQLKARGLLPWLDEWNLVPGRPWQDALEAVLGRIKAAAVFLGPGGRRPRQDQEIRALLDQFAQEHKPLIPVVLPGVTGEPEMPKFVKTFTWVDFRQSEPAPMERLAWESPGGGKGPYRWHRTCILTRWGSNLMSCKSGRAPLAVFGTATPGNEGPGQ
jgi:hypothetical protein